MVGRQTLLSPVLMRFLLKRHGFLFKQLCEVSAGRGTHFPSQADGVLTQLGSLGVADCQALVHTPCRRQRGLRAHTNCGEVVT